MDSANQQPNVRPAPTAVTLAQAQDIVSSLGTSIGTNDITHVRSALQRAGVPEAVSQSCFRDWENCATRGSGPIDSLDCAAQLAACLKRLIVKAE
jgi:hypothetical protein